MGRGEGLGAWSLVMMALGTVIGGSFLLGSAVVMRSAGPAGLISFILGGGVVYLILTALSEMAVADPATGSFRTYAERQFGSGAGFVVGWVYWTGLVLALSSEAIAFAILLRAWIPQLPLGLFAAAMVVSVTLANLLGAHLLVKLETGLAAVKLLALAAFIALAAVIIAGLLPGEPAIGWGALTGRRLFPGGIGGVLGSMLIAMFAYGGFEVIGLAAAEARDPHRTIPKAIGITIVGLVGLYTLSVAVLLPLVPTGQLSEGESPFVAGLEASGMGWAAGVVNFVMVTAILSTMLAAMFGLGRMVRSLTEEGHAPAFLRDRGEVPRRGILFSGVAMLAGIALGTILLQQTYLFLVSSGGFALLFVYLGIMLSHRRFRRKHGCPRPGYCRLPGFPYTSWLGIIALIVIMASMPLIPGQGSGLPAGLALVGLYAAVYWVSERPGRMLRRSGRPAATDRLPDAPMEPLPGTGPGTSIEAGEEISPSEITPEGAGATKETADSEQRRQRECGDEGRDRS